MSFQHLFHLLASLDGVLVMDLLSRFAFLRLVVEVVIEAFEISRMSSSKFSETLDNGFELFGEGYLSDQVIVLWQGRHSSQWL